jgi:uncharacterized membrane protein
MCDRRLRQGASRELTRGGIIPPVEGHSHAHGEKVEAPPELARRLNLALIPFVVATVVGLILLWPSNDPIEGRGSFVQAERISASVIEVDEHPCADVEVLGDDAICASITVRLDEGEDAGEEVSFEFRSGAGSRQFEEGDAVWMSANPDPTVGEIQYNFDDLQRRTPLLLLVSLFVVAVVGFSRWRGLAALAALAVTVLVLTRFILPAILEGSDPLMVSVVGAAVIMFAALYMSHGWSTTTTTAVLGTLTSLAITGLLALLFVELTKFTGLASEEAAVLQLSADQINLNGLLLGGIIIGALGVLDDVTVTQASAVWAIHRANPAYGPRALYGSALRIGRDHIASTVNTLVLAYAGASLPLLILLVQSNRSIADVLTGELLAEEIVRTLVGSIGLVASVPITTWLAAWVAGSSPPAENGTVEGAPADPQPARPSSWRAPRAERAWRDDE